MNSQDVVNYLNTLLEIDRDAVGKLIASRVECNEALANHPTVQTGKRDDGKYEVGLLGILNGLFTINEKGYGEIYLVVERDLIAPVKFITREEYNKQK